MSEPGPIGAGATIAHYRVIRRLGAGGMGEVFLAHDTQLDRDVALKLLPAELLDDPTARARLAREARLASALNHPNICTVHEVGEDAGRAYLAMEWIEGRTLDQVIPPHGLPGESAARIGAGIAAALAAAHRQGIVHRDLKSANVMIGTDGRVKVMDFGLARRGAPEEGGASSLTSTGVVVGSPQYMAPEMLRGGVADARSDLWALGVVLYEMCAGTPPFRGQSTIEVGAAILNAEPTPLPMSVPAGIRAVIQRCLAKDPAQRYQMAEEVRAALETAMAAGPALAPAAATHTAETGARGGRRGGTALWTGAAIAFALVLVLVLQRDRVLQLFRGDAGAGRIRSLAVLPLENLSRDPEQDYFADGMTEELIASLASLDGVRVISRTSVMQYRGTKKRLPEIARELGVDAVIEGSAMKAGDRVRITAQLIEAAHDRHLWAKSYERDLRDVLALQDEVARAIAGEIQLTLTPRTSARLASARPVDPAAHEAYLKGRALWNRRSNDGLKGAVEQFQRAIAIDSTYAQAYAALASSYYLWGAYGVASPNDVLPLARAAAIEALRRDDQLGEAHATLANVKLDFDWDWSGAGEEFRRAIAIDPNNATAHQWYAEYLSDLRRPDEALAEMDRARLLDPLSSVIRTARAEMLGNFGRVDEALREMGEVERVDPSFQGTYYNRSTLYEELGRLPEALQDIAFGDSLAHEPPEDAQSVRRAWERDGAQGYWTQMVRVLDRRAQHEPFPHSILAYYAVHAGDRGRALTYLRKMIDEHSDDALRLNVDRGWDPLRSDPEFQALVRRIGLTP